MPHPGHSGWGFPGNGVHVSYADLDQDFVPRFPRPLADEESARAEVLLDDASFWLGVWVPGLQGAIDGGNEQVVTAAKLLVVAMVRRVLLAPRVDEGVQSQTLQAGQFQSQIAYRNPDGNLYLYARELAALEDLIRGSTASAVSMTSPGL